MDYEKIFAKNLTTLLFLALLSLFLLFLDQKQFLTLPKSIIQVVTLPIQSAVYDLSQSIRNQFEIIFDARTAAKKNKALEVQYSKVLTEMGRLREVEKENQLLKDQMGNLSQEKYRLAPVQVVGLGRNLIINRGEGSGIKIGETVVYLNSLVGKIILVSGQTSAVLLPTNSESKIPVFIQTQGGGYARGVTRGEFGSGIMLDRVLQEETITEGDLVLTSGDGDYPRGLVVGKIKKVEKNETEIFQKAQIEPLFNYEDLGTVFVSLQP